MTNEKSEFNISTIQQLVKVTVAKFCNILFSSYLCRRIINLFKTYTENEEIDFITDDALCGSDGSGSDDMDLWRPYLHHEGESDRREIQWCCNGRGDIHQHSL